MKTKLITLLSILALYSFSQKGYIAGYILKGNDTIKGKVKDKLISFTPGRIKFIGNNGKSEKLNPRQIKGYGKLGLINFRSIKTGPFRGGTRFAQVLEDGDLILYTYSNTSTHHGTTTTYNGGGSFSSNYNGMNSTRQNTYYFLQRKSKPDEVERVPPMSFYSFMASYVSDDKELKKMLEDKAFNYYDIDIIVKKYNLNKKGNK